MQEHNGEKSGVQRGRKKEQVLRFLMTSAKNVYDNILITTIVQRVDSKDIEVVISHNATDNLFRVECLVTKLET